MTTTQCTCTGCAVQQGTHQPVEALHQIDEPQPEAYRLADECDESATHWVHEIDTRFKAAKMLRAQQARIAELEGSVTHLENVYGAAIRKVVELEQGKCLHQIAEPAAPVEKQIKDAIDALVWAAFTEGGCSEHRMSEARIQTELRKKELCTLIAATQPAAQGLDALAESVREAFAKTCDAAEAQAKETGESAKQKGDFASQLVAGGAASQAERLAIYFRGSEFAPALHAALAAQAKQGEPKP